jgi:soluble lytic murein transglycosylase-like protein
LKFLKYFLLLTLSFLYGNSYSNPLDSFIGSLHEQEASVEWVKNNAHDNISDTHAHKIVINAYAQAFSKNLNPHMVLSIIKNESGFRDNVKSHEGALGLMQVIPKWHRDKFQGRSPTNSVVSIEVGTTILSDCLDKFNNNHFKSLNCYSGGGGNKYFSKVKMIQEDLKSFVKNMNTPNLLTVAKL